MEDKLFYAYLKYQKDSMRNAWSNLLKWHWPILLTFTISVAFTIATLIVSLVPSLNKWSWIGVVVMIASYVVLMHMTENFQIKQSHEKFAEYCGYCTEMKLWLADFSIDSKEKIVNIRGRISGKISDMKNSHEKSAAGMDKWLQGFALPIVLAIVTTVIAGEDATEAKVAMTFVVILLFALTWYLCGVGAKMLNFNRKRKVEQLECFASDLQGILDTQFEGGLAFRCEQELNR